MEFYDMKNCSRRIKFLWIVVVALAASLVNAEEVPVELKVGDAAPAWSDLPGTDDRMHSLADLKDKRVVVVCFTCNSCPYSVDYEDRLIEFQKKFNENKKGIVLVAINSNAKPAENLDKMKERARAKNFPFPYLMDATQSVAASYGAHFTPEFFVLNRDRRIVYRGAMDDKTDASQVEVRFVELAVAAALNDEFPEVTTNPARGCTIPFKRKKR